MKDYKNAQQTIKVTVGESVKILRELQELSQNDLAALTGIPQSTISAIKNGRVQLWVWKEQRFSLEHSAVLVFPGWYVDQESAA